MESCKAYPRRQLDELKVLLERSLVCLAILFLYSTIYLSSAAGMSTRIFLASGDTIVSSGKEGKVSVDSHHQAASKVSLDHTFGWISRPESRQRAGTRWLSGIGSTPPNCASKCAKCTPCNAVRVPIQPGRKAVGLMEYYPEAWRCKCKNKLFMP